MEIIILLVIVAVGLIWYFNSKTGLDANNDGKVDVSDAKAMVSNVVQGVKSTADANNDGKVDMADAKVVAEKAKTKAKKVATKAKETVKKTTEKKAKPKA